MAMIWICQLLALRPLSKKTKKDDTLTKKTSQDRGTKPKASSGSSSLPSSQEINQNATATKPKPKPRPKPAKAKPNHNMKTTKNKPKEKTATKKTVTKKEMLQMVATLKTIVLQVIVKCILDFSQAENHMSKPERRQITESMIATGQLDKTIQKVYKKSLELMADCMENRPSDRQPTYKLSVAFFIRDIVER